jgi:triosephosphate isomerase
MRTPLIAANWKMNTVVSEGITLAQEIKTGIDGVAGVEKVLCPPFASLVPISEITRGSSIKLGAQNVHFEEKGAYTGEISPLMLKGICEFVIIGHSERRRYFNETNDIVNKKIKACFKNGLKPILCVGENLKENETGKTEEIVTGQVTTALDGADSPEGLIIAYEPVWAIGTGKSATGKQASLTIGLIRHTVTSLYDKAFGDTTRILYGGSVSPDNIVEFMQESEIDGTLVGGASLRADRFIAIVRQAAETKKTR